MNVYPLTLERVDEFIGYCKKYRKECDESYLPDDFFKPIWKFSNSML